MFLGAEASLLEREYYMQIFIEYQLSLLNIYSDRTDEFRSFIKLLY